jgi:muramidase (phage lysozyme)
MTTKNLTPNTAAALDLGIPLGQQEAIGGALEDRAIANRAIGTRRALGDMLASAEGVTHYPDQYAVGFGGAKIDTAKPHPGVVGAYKGKPVSAAGRYQFTLDTWKDAHGGVNVPMTPDNQEKALDYLLRNRAKVKDKQLANGDIGGMLPRLGKIWASLPTSTSGQPQRTNEYLVDALKKSGASPDVIASFDNAGMGVKAAASPISHTERVAALQPMRSELAAATQQAADAKAMQAQQRQRSVMDMRNSEVDNMVADALHGTNKLVAEPDGLPTHHDEALLKIIRQA